MTTLYAATTRYAVTTIELSCCVYDSKIATNLHNDKSEKRPLAAQGQRNPRADAKKLASLEMRRVITRLT